MEAKHPLHDIHSEYCKGDEDLKIFWTEFRDLTIWTLYDEKAPKFSLNWGMN